MADNRTTLAGRMTIGAVVGVCAAAYWLTKMDPADAADAHGLVAGGLIVGAAAPYIVNCWNWPEGRCPAPTWFWLRWIGLQGCGGKTRETDGEGHGRQKGRCWAHPDGPYIRLVSRLMGRDGKAKDRR